MESLSKHFHFFCLCNKLLRLHKMSNLQLHCFLNSFCELLDIFYFFLVLVVYFLNDFKRSMRLTEDLEWSFTVGGALFLFNLHAVACSLCTFNVEINVAILFLAFYTGPNLTTFLATNYTSERELWEVHLVHFNRRPWSYNRPLHPHAAAMVDPVIKGISYWSRSLFKLRLVSLDKVAVVFRYIVVLFLMLVILEFICFLIADYNHFIRELRQT